MENLRAWKIYGVKAPMRSVKNRQARLKIDGVAYTRHETIEVRFDLWLTRAAQFAQVGGIALALFGLYYTVIPLYQKAAVDEQLARAGIELKQAEQTLAITRVQTYELLRERLMLPLAFSAPDECAELRKAIGQVPIDESKEQRRKAILGFEVDITDCLAAQIDSIQAKAILSPKDIEMLASNAQTLGRELMKERQEVEERITSLPVTARVDSSLLAPFGDFVLRAHAKIDEWDARLPPQMRPDRREERLVAQIEWTQERLAQEFRSHAASRIRGELIPKSWEAAARAHSKTQPKQPSQ